MQMWDPKSLGDEAPPLPEWDNAMLSQFRKELVIDMLYCPENEKNDTLEDVINLPQRRVADRGKKIQLKDPWTNPRTKSLVRRTKRAPKGKKRAPTSECNSLVRTTLIWFFNFSFGCAFVCLMDI
ncbi:hypothetical protein PIB30_029489 [Stylosanthes scabra]|uniref:Uncharacterized protein n=1 Tax=Stylosanthes scabra TaxID=79078 RepID=A0ABU6RBK7_9FABA|nr:hypothetical protein [Stylosanthes scabra]